MANRIGRYEVQDELGRGGFGRVFRAFDPSMGSMVAIKILAAGGEPDLLIRFRNEAAAARKLQQKNIVTVYDFGEEDRVPYIVMELLDGEDLQRVIANHRPLTALQKMRIMSQVAEGLHYAHLHGVVHRDVKPANIMLLSDDSVKIMDFGIAKVAQATGPQLTPQGTTVGTFRYMAPEQFEGTASDTLCDIFSYGLVFYELLTGTHPFEAAVPAAVMRNIVQAQPRPVRELCSNCPNGLEAVVRRLLHKDRELRYQSLEDVQFDIQPILIDLQKTHAAELLARSRDLAARDQVDTAQALVREILRLDPGNASARELREMLQEQAQRKVVRARVEGLLKTGREKMAQQDYSGAIASLESALHVDRSNPEIQTLMQQARAAMEQAQRVRFLLGEAQCALDLRDLTGAYKNASEALQMDPGNSKASVLLKAVLQEKSARERERRLQEGISRAKGLLMLQAFDEAIGLLLELQPDYPESREISDLLARVRLDKSVHERRERLMAGITAAKDLLRNQRLADAVPLLEQLAREFPETAEVRDLLGYAREELAAHQLAETVKRATEEARALLDAKEFDRAIDTLNKALRSFPGEESLSYLLQIANSAKASWDRQWALTEALHLGQRLLVEQRYEEVIRRIDAFVSAHGSDADLAGLRKRAQAEWEIQIRIEAIGKVMGQAQDLLTKGRPGSASRILQEATAEFPGSRELASLLQVAETQLLEQRRAEAIELVVNEARELTTRFEFDRAEQMVQETLKQYPEDAGLGRCLEATRLARSSYQQDQEKQKALQQGIQLHRKGRFADAAAVVETALRVHPNDSELLDLKARIDADWEQRSEAVQRVSDQARALMGRRLVEQAIALLEDKLKIFPNEPELTLLLTQAQHQLQARRQAEEAQLRERPQQTQPPPEIPQLPAPPSVETPPRGSWRRVALVAAAVTVLGASILAVYRQMHPRVSEKPRAVAAQTKTESGPISPLKEPRAEPKTKDLPTPVPAERRKQASIKAPETGSPVQGTSKRQPVAPGGRQPKPGPSDQVSPQANLPAAPLPPDTSRTAAPPLGGEHAKSGAAVQEPGSGSALPKPAPPPETPKAASAAGPQGNQDQNIANEDREWNAVNKNDPQALRSYLGTHPDGTHKGEATSKIEELEWTNLDKNNLAALEDFARRSTGPSTALARHEIQRINQKADEANSRGVGAFKLKHYDEAIADFSEFIGLKPNAATGYFNRGSVYFELGRWKEAAADLSASTARDPRDLRATKLRSEAQENQAAGVYKLGVTSPTCTQGVAAPLYTREALKAGVKPATVTLRVVVDERGRPAIFRVDKPIGYGLDEAAINAVKTAWTCWAGKKDGKKVAVEVSVVVPFGLP